MAKRTKGRNVEVAYDSTGGFVQLDWTCPYCHEDNKDFRFAKQHEILAKGAFEINVTCDWCGKEVIAVCEKSRPMI